MGVIVENFYYCNILCKYLHLSFSNYKAVTFKTVYEKCTLSSQEIEITKSSTDTRFYETNTVITRENEKSYTRWLIINFLI